MPGGQRPDHVQPEGPRQARGRRRAAWRGAGSPRRSARAACRCPGPRPRARTRSRSPRPRPRPRSRAVRTTSRSRAARRARWATSDDRAARHREVVVDADELDAREVGDLGGGGAHDVEQRDRLLPLPRLLGTRQHEQALRVAPHAGRHVVELEQRVERGGVVLVALELVEQLELALEQALVAAGEVHEQVAHALAQQARLLAARPPWSRPRRR